MHSAHKAEQRPGRGSPPLLSSSVQHSSLPQADSAKHTVFIVSLHCLYQGYKRFQKYVSHFSNIITYPSKTPLFPYNASLGMAIRMNALAVVISKSKQVFTTGSTILGTLCPQAASHTGGCLRISVLFFEALLHDSALINKPCMSNCITALTIKHWPASILAVKLFIEEVNEQRKPTT